LPKWLQEGKVALITGGSSGIGFAVARELLKNKLRVILLARRKNVLEEAKKRLQGGDNVEIVSADVTKFDTLIEAKKHIVSKFGKVDLLFNSVGITEPSLLSDIKEKDIHALIEVNLLGVINVCKTFIDSISNGGAIINISSVLGLFGIAGYSAYSASKFGIVGFSDALRRELFKQKISVHVAYPPDTETPQYRYELEHMQEWMKRGTRAHPLAPEIVAKRILRGAKRGMKIILPSASTKFYGFMLHYMPKLSRFLLDRIAPKP
jgi:3-dehydrosphinganine reductase